MALDGVDERMEELDEQEEQEGREGSADKPSRHAGADGRSRLRTMKKTALCIAMIAVAGMLAYFLLKPGGGKGTAVSVSTKSHELGLQTVNLQDGKTGLRVNVVVELNDPRCIDDVAAKESLLRDKVIEILSVKTIEDINSVVKRNRLKRELLDDFNLELNLEDGRLMKIYFREFFHFNLEAPAGE